MKYRSSIKRNMNFKFACSSLADSSHGIMWALSIFLVRVIWTGHAAGVVIMKEVFITNIYFDISSLFDY